MENVESLLLEFSTQYQNFLDEAIRDSLALAVQRNQADLSEITLRTIYSNTHDLVWKNIKNNLEFFEDPNIVIIGKNDQQRYIAYKQKLYIKVSKASDNRTVHYTRFSKTARKFHLQQNLDHLGLEQIHAYLYYLTDAMGYAVTETGLLCPKGIGIPYTRILFSGDLKDQPLLFNTPQPDSTKQKLDNLKKNFQKKLIQE